MNKLTFFLLAFVMLMITKNASSLRESSLNSQLLKRELLSLIHELDEMAETEDFDEFSEFDELEELDEMDELDEMEELDDFEEDDMLAMRMRNRRAEDLFSFPLIPPTVYRVCQASCSRDGRYLYYCPYGSRGPTEKKLCAIGSTCKNPSEGFAYCKFIA
eukprot:TRINITY_DN585_c0_g1_i1.p1 TRINITY_DN585_c0_g1~~TRINITY_DN585_c0_g1_i1.p1  ORF type:complete len:160 (+),score=35.83 TRINITY_DN585_c0_g1_i1:91-570(+)